MTKRTKERLIMARKGKHIKNNDEDLYNIIEALVTNEMSLSSDEQDEILAWLKHTIQMASSMESKR